MTGTRTEAHNRSGGLPWHTAISRDAPGRDCALRVSGWSPSKAGSERQKARSQGTSHYVFKIPWPGDPRVNIQDNGGKAKPYQVKQVLTAIKKLEERS